MKISNLGVLCVLWCASVLSPALQAQQAARNPECTDPQVILACQGNAVLTQATVNGAFSRIPDDARLEFIRDGAMVDKMVKDLLQLELLALDADANGYSQDALVQQRVLLAARKELADAWMQEIDRRAPEVDFTVIAHEEYLANPVEFTIPATVDVTHILISTNTRTLGEAQEIAIEVSSQLAKDPTRFDALVLQYSDDPGKLKNGGKYKGMTYEQLVKPFAEAAFAMQKPGDISQPVETEYGVHLIRLDSKATAQLQPWEKVEADAVKQAKVKYLNTYRANYLKKVLYAPIEFPEGSVEVMAKRWFGDDLQKAPIFTEDGAQLGTTDQE